MQNPDTTVIEAARAMRTNEVGCIVVWKGRRVVGIVTDRDLALRVVGGARDPRKTQLGDVMTPDVYTLHPGDDHATALRLMRERQVRRVPLVEAGRVVGIVTADDLLLDEAAPLADIAAVIRAQLVEGGPARTRRFDEWRAWERSYARAHATKTKLVRAVQRAARLHSAEQAEAALGVVLSARVRRLSPQSAAKLVQRLPVLLQEELAELPPGPDTSIRHATVAADAARVLHLDRERAAEVVDAVGTVLDRSIGGDGARRLHPALGRASHHVGSQAARCSLPVRRSPVRRSRQLKPKRASATRLRANP